MQLVIINPPRADIASHQYRFLKRALDLLVCAVVLPLSLPLLAILVLAIRIDSAGPAIIRQERIGKGGQCFTMYKFRTMLHNLDDSAHRAFMIAFVRGSIPEDESGSKVYKPFKPSQVTRFGRILRKTSLDELPQLFNVLKGEMSLVGPRPNVPWEVGEYDYWHHERLEVLPGITGLAQVRGRSSIKFDRIVEYDVEYVRRQSILLDMKILFWTLMTVFGGRGAS